MLFAHPLEWYADTAWGPVGVYTNSSHGSILLLGHSQLWVRCEFETARVILVVGGLLTFALVISIIIWIMNFVWKQVMRGHAGHS